MLEPSTHTTWATCLENHHGYIPIIYNPDIITFYHKHFRWHTYFLILQKNGNAVGLFPIVNTKKAWVSMPHFSYGGVLGNTFPDITYSKLCAFAEKHLSDKKSGYYTVDINHLSQSNVATDSRYFIRSQKGRGGALKSEKAVSIITLPETVKQMWDMLQGNLRRKISKAGSNGYEVAVGGEELLNDFYKVYVRNIRKLRSMNYSYAYFNDMLKSWHNGDIKIFVIRENNKPVAGSVLIEYMGYYENTYFATLPSHRKNYISDLLHWKMIEYIYTCKASGDISTIYSFGRSTVNSGVHTYKNHWPVDNHPIYIYTNYPDIRDKTWLTRIWSVLPGFVTREVGKRLIGGVY